MRLHQLILLIAFVALVSCGNDNEIISLVDGETRLSASELVGSDNFTIVYSDGVPIKLIKSDDVVLSEDVKDRLQIELSLNGVDSLIHEAKPQYLYSYAPGNYLLDVFSVECEKDTIIKFYFRQDKDGKWIGPLSTSHWVY